MITLTPLKVFEVPIQAPCITPENFAGKSITEIAKLPLTEGNRNVTLGDLFKIEETPSETPNITIKGDCSKVKRVGQGIKSGEILVEGNIGMHTGEKMAGGKIVVNGNTGGWTGSEMTNGTIEIHGDSGDYMASPYRGNDLGMKGGSIIVDGNVGTDVGCYLKGGVIKIKGSAGRFLGFHMSDGAIYVEKDCDVRAGALMNGGKIDVDWGQPHPQRRPACQLAYDLGRTNDALRRDAAYVEAVAAQEMPLDQRNLGAQPRSPYGRHQAG